MEFAPGQNSLNSCTINRPLGGDEFSRGWKITSNCEIIQTVRAWKDKTDQDPVPFRCPSRACSVSVCTVCWLCRVQYRAQNWGDRYSVCCAKGVHSFNTTSPNTAFKGGGGVVEFWMAFPSKGNWETLVDCGVRRKAWTIQQRLPEHRRNRAPVNNVLWWTITTTRWSSMFYTFPWSTRGTVRTWGYPLRFAKAMLRVEFPVWRRVQGAHVS